MLGSGLFITGTDTGVGKTVVAAAVTRALRAAHVAAVACKPIETGVDGEEGEDAALLRRAADGALTASEVCDLRLPTPAAPLRAARAAGVVVEVARLSALVTRLRQRHPFVVVEGIGGVGVPLTPETTLLDWLATLRIPALVVTTPRLGTLNHTWLTVRALRAAHVAVVGMVVNRVVQDATTVAELHAAEDLTELCGLPLIACLPEVTTPARQTTWDSLARQFDGAALYQAAYALSDRTESHGDSMGTGRWEAGDPAV